MSLTALRTGLRDELAADLGIPAADGFYTGRSERNDLVGVWIDEAREGAVVSDQEIELTVRVRKLYVSSRSGEAPADPTLLEEAAEAVDLALRDKQAASFGVWFFRVTGVAFDYEEWGFDVRLLAFRDNPFAAGG